jgi:hypothetical protein
MVQAGFLGKHKLLEREWKNVEGNILPRVLYFVIILELQCFFICVWILI